MEFIFISIPRTGTNSINKILGQAPNENHKSIKMINRKGYSFGFTRNPYDLVLSWYLYHRAYQPHHEIYQKLFFFNWVIEGCPHHWEDGFLKDRGLTHPLNQFEYLCNSNGNLAVDFIGRYETLQLHFNEVCEKIGIEASPLPRINGTGRKSRYIEHYNATTYEKIKAQFKTDFKLFNYQ